MNNVTVIGPSNRSSHVKALAEGIVAVDKSKDGYGFPSFKANSGELIEERLKNQPMSIEQAASYLGVSPASIYKLTSQGKIPHSKPMRRLIFFKDDLDRWVRSHAVVTNEQLELAKNTQRIT